MRTIETDVAVIGSGLGGVAAALAVADRGYRVVLTEQTRWIGGQLTSQAVPPDENPWIEQFGCTARYRALRDGIRAYYRRHYPLSALARRARWLNPGDGRVSRLCHEPRVALAVMEELLAPYRSRGLVTVLTGTRPVAADVDGDRVHAVVVRDTDGHDRDGRDGRDTEIRARYVLDATEAGDLLPLTGTEHVTGFESRDDTGEPHAPAQAQPDNVQAASICFALEHRAGEDHTIERPTTYDTWRAATLPSWPGPLLSWTAPDPRTGEAMTRTFVPNPDDEASVAADQSKDPGDKELWTFRRIAARHNFADDRDSDVTLVNWPMIDYVGGSIYHDTDQALADHHLAQAKQLSLSMLHWMQTEAPRTDGGTGFPGLRLRGDLLGTDDGLAMAPYVRESRRIKALYTIVEQDVSYAVRGDHGAVRYPDSVGIGSYRIDLHPSTGGDGYIDVANSPFEIPLRALVPQRMRNLLPAGKNLGTTHITNGCYRLHPVEWNIGEVAGLLAAFCLRTGSEPQTVAGDPGVFAEFESVVLADGIETHWPTPTAY